MTFTAYLATLFAIQLAISLLAALIWRRRPVRAVAGALLTCCLLVTAYTIVFAPDAQAPIALLYVYIPAVFAGILVVGLCHLVRSLSRRLTAKRG